MPFPASRSNPSIDSCRQVTPHARTIVWPAEHVAGVEMHLTRLGVDPCDRSGHEDLGTEPARLLQGTTRQLVTRHTRREAEVVLDPRRCAGLAAGRLPLDHDRSQSLRCSVHGSSEPGGAGADDHRVVLGGDRLGAESEKLGHAPELRPNDGLAVDDANRRAVLLRRQRAAPVLCRVRCIGCEPSERDLIAIQEAAQVGARRVPAMADHDRPGRRRRGRDALQPGRSTDSWAASRATSFPISGADAATSSYS